MELYKKPCSPIRWPRDGPLQESNTANTVDKAKNRINDVHEECRKDTKHDKQKFVQILNCADKKTKIDKAKNKISNVQSVAHHSGILPIDSNCL